MNGSKLGQSAKYLSRRRKEIYDRIIRVDHSGELGADRIYCGQMFVLRNDPKHSRVIQEMWNQEKDHFSQFEILCLKHRVRKSLFEPFWSVGGFALGVGTALLGPKAAMACTVAVEQVISSHYDNQLRQLIEDDLNQHKDLIQIIQKFRDEEQHHYETGLQYDAQKATGFQFLTNIISNTCKIAIKIAERI
jgi:ubiquinone biosynthesis monooxygenase Coq7